MDTSRIYLVFSNYKMERIVPVYIGTHIGASDQIQIEGEFSPLDLEYKRGVFCDIMTICTDLKVSVEGYEIKFPSTVQISLKAKLLLWWHFRGTKLKFRFLSRHERTNNIKPLTSFLDLMIKKRIKTITVTQQVEVDDTDSSSKKEDLPIEEIMVED